MQFAIFRRTIFRTFLRGGLIILLMSVGMAYLEPGSSSIQENVDRYYKEQITAVNRELNNLKKSNHQGAPVKELRHNFISARLAYKKLAVLSEYFNVYDSKFLNGPALNRAEDGTPDIIIPPQGFQALEEKIFSTDPFATRTESIRLIDDMLKFLKRLEDERDRLNKFSPAAVWDALRAAIVRIVALGITGYDSPVALHSLPEARASLQAINDILVLFNTEIDRTVPGAQK